MSLLKYDEQYIQSHDIDWFCVVNQDYIYVSSVGGQLPEKVNHRMNLRKLQYEVDKMPEIYTNEEIDVNYPFLHSLLQTNENDDEKIKDYLGVFLSMSRKGFIALDRTDINDPDDPNYHVVCVPKGNKELVKPEHIFSFETQEVGLFSGSLENIHLVEILDHIDNGR